MSFVSPVPQSAVVTITPAMAQELLATSPGNRPIRDNYVKILAAAMKRGEWLVTSQGIGIDINGQLRDAHHRLHACLLANIPFQSTVVWGLPKEAYQVTDRGLTRSYGDILDCPAPVAETLRLAGTLLTGNSRPTARQIKPLMDRGFQDIVEALTSYCPKKVRYFSSAPFKLCAVMQILNNINTDFVYTQYRALVMANYDEMTPASKALTRRVQTGSPLSSSDKLDCYARALIVFNPAKSYVCKIQIEEASRSAAAEYIRNTLTKFISTPIAA